jgi:HTH-type transcriptional regulator, competence development regulator
MQLQVVVEGESGDSEMTFGERLRALRVERCINQKELAAAAGIDVTYLSKLENSRLEPPAEETIRRLAAALETESTELLLLAHKVPSDLKPIITASPMVPRFLRAARNLTDEEWQALIAAVEAGEIGK